MMSREQTARVLVSAAVGFALLVPLVGGVIVADHSHRANFISELGAVGTRYGSLISFAGFLPTGVLTAAFLIVAAPLVSVNAGAKIGYYLLFSVAIAYIGAAFAPCDFGCPGVGSVRQLIHNLLGTGEYIGGGLGLLMFAGTSSGSRLNPAIRTALGVAGATTLVAFFVMATPELGQWRGFFQRLAEAALFGSLLVLGWKVTESGPIESQADRQPARSR